MTDRTAVVTCGDGCNNVPDVDRVVKFGLGKCSGRETSGEFRTMEFLPTELPGVILIEPRVFEDARGFFVETYHAPKFAGAGIDAVFVQDNLSRSRKGVLRGMHYQLRYPQGKLVRAVQGEVFDVAVDLRKSSATFGEWTGALLSEENKRQFYIPPGFAHGFCVLSDSADVLYKCTDTYHPEDERTILWNDPDVGVAWPVDNPIVSARDQRGALLSAAEVYE